MNHKPKAKMVKATDGSLIKAYQPELRLESGPKDPTLAVKELIFRHTGAAKAITIEQIAQELFSADWWFARLDGYQRQSYPHREAVQRLVKSVVQRLRRTDKRIGASRGDKKNPGGYYLISSDAELRDTVKPYIRQALTMLHTAEGMTGLDLYTHELEAKFKQLGGLTLPAAPAERGANSEL